MTKTVGFSIRRLWDILLSIAIVAAGVCLIGGCLSIYRSADGYSREAVAAVFSDIAIPVYLALAFTVAGFVWELISPCATYRKTPKAYGAVLARLHSQRDPQGDKQTWQAIQNEQARRRTYAVIRTVLLLIGCAVFFGYAVQPIHYTEDINASVLRAMWVAIPCFAVPAVFAVITAYRNNKSFQREIDLLKTLPRGDVSLADNTPTAKRRTVLSTLRILLIVLAVAALIYGFVAGGTVDVLTKAINICTECIGLG